VIAFTKVILMACRQKHKEFPNDCFAFAASIGTLLFITI
jgi:hypothetical protein